jgi:hypothetical protein
MAAMRGDAGTDGAGAEALTGMKMSELRKYAADMGLGREDIARAIDSDRPKQALVDTIVHHSRHDGRGTFALVTELRALRQSSLEDRAQAEGVSQRELVNAIDDDDSPRGAIVRLIVQRRMETGSAERPSPTVAQPALDSTLPVCPFCTNRSLSNGPAEVPAGGRTRQRRELKSERKTPKWGRWWRQLGYNGPKCKTSQAHAYELMARMHPNSANAHACTNPDASLDIADCQRCSEVLRDHIMRQKPNSALCTRAQPCDDCKKVLEHFMLSGDALWAKFDERAQQNKLKRAVLSVDGANLKPGAKSLGGLSQDGSRAGRATAHGGAQKRAKTLGRASVSMPGTLDHSADRAAADLTHAQRKNEFAALLASLHNQPFDATREGIASRAVAPATTDNSATGMRPPGLDTHSRVAPPAGNWQQAPLHFQPHLQPHLQPQPQLQPHLHAQSQLQHVQPQPQLPMQPHLKPMLANRPLSDPGDDPEQSHGAL